MIWTTTSGCPAVNENVLAYMNRMGAHGWEPFFIEPHSIGDGGRATVFFKKKVRALDNEP